VWPCCGHAHDLSLSINYNYNFIRTYIYIMYIPRPCQVPTTTGWHTDSYENFESLSPIFMGTWRVHQYPSVSPAGGLPELQEGWRSRPASLWRGASAKISRLLGI
jgi:hypothetical protein